MVILKMGGTWCKIHASLSEVWEVLEGCVIDGEPNLIPHTGAKLYETDEEDVYVISGYNPFGIDVHRSINLFKEVWF